MQSPAEDRVELDPQELQSVGELQALQWIGQSSQVLGDGLYCLFKQFMVHAPFRKVKFDAHVVHVEALEQTRQLAMQAMQLDEVAW